MENPLNNHLVLQSIFKFCKGSDAVKRNRLVNSIWYEASKPQWAAMQKTVILYRKRSACSAEPHDVADEIQRMTLEQLLEEYSNPKSSIKAILPWVKVQFRWWMFDRDLLNAVYRCLESHLVPSIDRWFWTVVAPDAIRHLELVQCDFPTKFVALKQWFLQALPNLEVLSLTNIAVFHDSKIESQVDFIQWCKKQHRQIDAPYDREAESVSGYQHQNLKTLILKIRLRHAGDWWPSQVWGPFFEMVPNLEKVHLRYDDDDFGSLPSRLANGMFSNNAISQVAGSLKCLDLLDLSTKAVKIGIEGELRVGDIPCFQRLEKLRCDVGFVMPVMTEEPSIRLLSLTPSLKRLHLYRAPFSEPLPGHFLNNAVSENLTELHLWGNISSELSFLNKVPNLETFVWNTSCYETDYHGKRLHSLFEHPWPVPYALTLQDLVAKTAEILMLQKMEKLEMDWGPMSVESWLRLGQCMPNLKSLKGLVTNEDQLVLIRKQWPHLEHLELAHGSCNLNGKSLITEVVAFNQLKSFVWKRCPCTIKDLNGNMTRELEDYQATMMDKLPEKTVFPWNIPTDSVHPVLPASIPFSYCIQKGFKQTLLTGNGTQFLKFMYPHLYSW